MSRELKFIGFLRDAQGGDTAEYVPSEPFPADGEPIYTTHPAFKYDEGLKSAKESAAIAIGLALALAMSDNSSRVQPSLDWLEGKTPIPDNHWEALLAVRKHWLKANDLPPDTPIGSEQASPPR